jgi:hypothetical protein
MQESIIKHLDSIITAWIGLIVKSLTDKDFLNLVVDQQSRRSARIWTLYV